MEGAFRGPVPPDLTIIETLRIDPAGSVRAARHIARMARTAAALGIPFDSEGAGGLLDGARVARNLRARLTLGADGELQLRCSDIQPTPAVWRLKLAEARIDSTDPWRRVKTSERSIYDTARAEMAMGTDELIFLNEHGEVAEGAITNVFLKTPGGLLTPPVEAGALPGILREELLAAGRVREARLRPADLDGGVLFMGNSLRGLVPAWLG